MISVNPNNIAILYIRGCNVDKIAVSSKVRPLCVMLPILDDYGSHFDVTSICLF